MEPASSLILLAFGALLLAALVCDLRTRRIPNGLVLAGMALGLLIQTVAPAGGGLFLSSGAGAIGPAAALLGCVTGLALLLPMYALRALGAGDVKLLAMAGVWLGAGPVAWATLWTMLAGGVLSLAWALGSGKLRVVFANLREMVLGTVVQAHSGAGLAVAVPTQTTGRLPYALAIASGVGIELCRQWLRNGS